ncbi:MAG: LysR substrate-binding domain-containing protein [Hyphomicrobiaceae bacterium]
MRARNCGPSPRPDDLADLGVPLFALPGYRSCWRFLRTSETVSDVAVRGRITVSNAVVLRDCARVGLGCALLADWLIDEDLAAGRLVDRYPQYEVAATTFETAARIVYPSSRFLPNKVRVTIDFLRQHLTGREGISLTSCERFHPARMSKSRHRSGLRVA